MSFFVGNEQSHVIQELYEMEVSFSSKNVAVSGMYKPCMGDCGRACWKGC
ncbi:hypothetical protein FM106_28010 [Brachybacterium faecium]|nr:hypothetical protein FM106_28010 [Brachybacterium faecium]